MFQPRTSIAVLLIAAAAFTGLALLVSLMNSVGTGTFTADYYYLPLRDYVDPSQRREMEDTVIDLYNAKQKRGATIAIILHIVPVVCIVISLWLLHRRPKNSDVNTDFQPQ